MENEFINAKEAALFLGISMANLYKLTSAKNIPFYKPSKKLYFKKSELTSYINKSKQA